MTTYITYNYLINLVYRSPNMLKDTQTSLLWISFELIYIVQIINLTCEYLIIPSAVRFQCAVHVVCEVYMLHLFALVYLETV